MGVYIGGPVIISDMQGPAPDGYHVPLNTERQAVYNVWTTLGGGSSDGTNFGIALKLPSAGFRDAMSASVGSQGTYGYYWSSSRYDADTAYYLRFNLTALNPQYYHYRAYGYSVRCFKNSPVIPTSSWTKLYGTSIEAGGIFWSSTDGLISLSSDGTTWITIQDKNLGATTVWNSGDTLSEANCGKYFQRGNNYGFPFTGSVTKSSTQVDASAYGPGNYYSSSTFITRNSSPYRWDTTDNGNLRGGVSQGSSEGIVMSEMKNAYIGEVYEYSYDFRNKSLSQITADGWNETKYNSNCGLSYGTNGVGVYRASGSYGVGGVYMQLPKTISSTDKITMKFTGLGGSGDTRGRFFVSLTDVPTVSLASSTQIETDLSMCIGNQSIPQGITTQKSENGTQTWDVYTLIRNVAGASGLASAECTIDLPNNKVSWECTAPSSQVYNMEGTITTAGKNCIIGTKYFIFRAGSYTSGVYHYLQTVSILVE